MKHLKKRSGNFKHASQQDIGDVFLKEHSRYFYILGARQETDIFVRLIDSATKQVY